MLRRLVRDVRQENAVTQLDDEHYHLVAALLLKHLGVGKHAVVENRASLSFLNVGHLVVSLAVQLCPSFIVVDDLAVGIAQHSAHIFAERRRPGHRLILAISM